MKQFYIDAFMTSKFFMEYTSYEAEILIGVLNLLHLLHNRYY